MVTNGWAWTPAVPRRAKDAGLRSIAVSLDGLEETHDAFRDRPGSFARARAAIAMLAADPFYQALDVATCVHPRNLGELPALGGLLASLGVRGWRFFTVSPIGRAAGQADLQPDAERYRALLDFILHRRAQGDLRVSLSESGHLGGAYECRVREAPCFCAAGIAMAGIMVDGAILACPNLGRRLAQGDARREPFVEVWESRFRPFRDRRWMREACAECAACGDWRLCRGNSLHLWDLDAGRPRICHLRDDQLDEKR